MAVRGWGGSVATAIGAAAGVGAAQLGLGYGLGIVAWLPTTGGASEATWVASLAWATFIAATSTVAGALTADRLAGNTTAPASGQAGQAGPDQGGQGQEPPSFAAALWRLALAVAAAVGALLTVALVAVPARAALRADTFSPQTIAAGYAVIGVIVGLLVAIGALASRAIAANVSATVAWLWLLAIVAVVDGVAKGRGLASAQLGVWQFTDDRPGYWFRNMYLPGVALSLGSALVIGALAAWPAARRGYGRVGIAVSGAVGPLLVASAYVLAAPRPVGVPAEQLSAYLVAPYAVIAGLAGSVLIATVGGRGDRSADGRDMDLVPKPRSGEPGVTGEIDRVRPDLPDDGYAPARAYATDSGVGTGSETGARATARGQATVTQPLWPPDATRSSSENASSTRASSTDASSTKASSDRASGRAGRGKGRASG